MKKIVTASSILLFSVFQLAAQKFEAALNTMAAKHQPEKIYIHYDKEYYVAGETIWFKAYLFNDGKPSAIGNNLYLQFTDSKGAVISNMKLPVMGAVAKGSITVPDSLPQGNYYLRALTPAMLSYDEAFVYKKNIFVFKPTATVATTPPSTVSVQFFPESGHLVDGVLTVVGFKATDQWGAPADVNGVIRLEDGTTIASFKTYHDGIGKVQFKPQAGKKYIAEVETDAGKRSYNLPEVKASGINLKVQDEKGGKKFQLSRSAKDKAEFESIWIVAELNNYLVYENQIKFEDYPSIIGHLVTDSLPSGILHFTVFNEDGVPLAERLSFVDNREYLANAVISPVKFSAERRAANSIELSFPELMQRSCSVSVTDMPGTGFNDNDDIVSRFLLTSDLKGHVYNPSWYFTNQNDTTKQALDNLLLTQGWSRFNWTKILANEFPAEKRADHPMISLIGKVTDEKTQEIQSGGKLNIYLEAEDSTTLNLEAVVDAAGRFRIDSLMFGGKAKIFYAYKDSKGKEKGVDVTPDNNDISGMMNTLPVGMLENSIVRNPNPGVGKDDITTRYNYLKKHDEEVKELERVVVQAKSNKKPSDIVNEQYTNGVFRSPGKVTLDNINEPASDKSMNVVDYIKNRIQQVEIQNNRFVNRKNVSLMSGQKWLVGVFLNEVPADIFQLRVLRVGDIALVKFFEAGFVGVGSGSPGGAISVYTKERFVEPEKADKLKFAEYKGYTITKEFYKPDYANAEVKHPSTDNRTTLYWNPDVYTDTENKSIKLDFFNNDFSKKFKVVVEGFDANGKLIHIEKIIGN